MTRVIDVPLLWKMIVSIERELRNLAMNIRAAGALPEDDQKHGLDLCAARLARLLQLSRVRKNEDIVRMPRPGDTGCIEELCGTRPYIALLLLAEIDAQLKKAAVAVRAAKNPFCETLGEFAESKADRLAQFASYLEGFDEISYHCADAMSTDGAPSRASARHESSGVMIEVKHDPDRIILNGEPFPATPDEATFLEQLVAGNGNWVSGWESRGIRPGRIKAALPAQVAALIESAPGKGQRLRADRGRTGATT